MVQPRVKPSKHKEMSETCSLQGHLWTPSACLEPRWGLPAQPWAALIWIYPSDYTIPQEAEGLSSAFYLSSIKLLEAPLAQSLFTSW